MRTLRFVGMCILHWMLQLMLFGVGCLVAKGAFEAVLYTIVACIISAPVYLLYPLALRLIATMRQPWLGLATTLCILVVTNDGLFQATAYKSSSQYTGYSADIPPLNIFVGFEKSEARPFRLCLLAATVLATIAMALPITNYFRRRATNRSLPPDSNNAALV